MSLFLIDPATQTTMVAKLEKALAAAKAGQYRACAFVSIDAAGKDDGWWSVSPSPVLTTAVIGAAFKLINTMSALLGGFKREGG